jgi:hypothetical protein
MRLKKRSKQKDLMKGLRLILVLIILYIDERVLLRNHVIVHHEI